jgi:hypothetical protein
MSSGGSGRVPYFLLGGSERRCVLLKGVWERKFIIPVNLAHMKGELAQLEGSGTKWLTREGAYAAE